MNILYKIVTVVAILLSSHYMIAQDRGLTNQAIRTLSASSEQVALVIGNSSYTKSPLKNAVNDANLMTSTLQNLGFDVMKYTNLSQKDMKRAFTSFGDKLKPHSVALVFYAVTV
ncbi:MAG: caspase family protein [Saprospiraceae bacterium]|nr:caspase family protein [Saprospiraceae bacterium]